MNRTPDFERERREAILIGVAAILVFGLGLLLWVGRGWPGSFGDWIRSWYTWKPFPLAGNSLRGRGNYQIGDVISLGGMGLGGGAIGCLLWAWHQKYGF
jgi:hypothetical protein